MTRHNFYRNEFVQKIFRDKKEIIDIGGGLRISSKNNRGIQNEFDIDLSRVAYQILDKEATFDPDIVGDIHALPFKDNSIDAICCVAVLEHVENPFLAMQEMYRCLKSGGYLYVYVPFIFYYHPMKGYYKDYWRFTYDSLELLTKDFSKSEIINDRGAFETIMNLFPLFSARNNRIFKFIDKVTGKSNSLQASGFNVFAIK